MRAVHQPLIGRCAPISFDIGFTLLQFRSRESLPSAAQTAGLRGESAVPPHLSHIGHGKGYTSKLDDLIADLVTLDAAEVWNAIEEMARRRVNPPMTIDEVCAVLEQYMPTALADLRTVGLTP